VQNQVIGLTSHTQPKPMVNNTLRKPLCLHIRQANSIHSFVFREASRAAVDQWIDYMDDILGTSPFDRPLRISLDTRESGTLPVAYQAQRLHDLFCNYDQRPLMRIALVSNQGALMLLIQMLAQITASDDQNVIQYYQAVDDADAEGWLLETT